MAFVDSAGDPGDGGGGPPPPGGPSGGPPGGGADDDSGGLLTALKAQQQGPSPSTPGPGTQANSMMMIQNAIALIQQAALGLAPGTPIHRDANRAVGSLSRHLSQGQPTAGAQQTQLGDLLRMIARSALLQQLRGQGGGQGDDAGGGQPPMPSTPLPGS